MHVYSSSHHYCVNGYSSLSHLAFLPSHTYPTTFRRRRRSRSRSRSPPPSMQTPLSSVGSLQCSDDTQTWKLTADMSTRFDFTVQQRVSNAADTWMELRCRSGQSRTRANGENIILVLQEPTHFSLFSLCIEVIA